MLDPAGHLHLPLRPQGGDAGHVRRGHARAAHAHQATGARLGRDDVHPRGGDVRLVVGKIRHPQPLRGLLQGADRDDAGGRGRRGHGNLELRPVTLVAAGRDDQSTLAEHLVGGHEAGQFGEQVDVGAVLLQGERGGRRDLHVAGVHQPVHIAGKIDAQRHGDDVRAFLQGPVNGPGQGGRGAAALAQHLADEGAFDLAGHADADALHILTEDGAGAVAAVAVQVIGSLLGKIALHQLHAGKGRVVRVDTGVEHGHDDAAAVVGRLRRAHRPDAPGRSRGGNGRLAPDRFDQPQGHGQGYGAGARVAAQVVALPLAQFDLLQLDHLPAQTGGKRGTGAGPHIAARRCGYFPAAQHHILFCFHG